jgi:cytoskeletal protein CcmA (bactofilin family)
MEETMNKRYPLAILIWLTLIISISQASIFLGTNNRNFEPGEIIDDDLFIGGNSIKFESDITGDLFGGSRELVFYGKGGGNINWAAQSITIGGAVKNSVRVFAYSIDVNGVIGKNLVAFAQNITVGPDTRVKKDATLFGGEIDFDGYLGENLIIQGARVSVSGKIDGDVSINAKTLEIKPNTVINGDLVYTSPAKIKIPNTVEIRGETLWVEVKPEEQKPEYRPFKPIIFSIMIFLVISFAYYLYVFIWLLFIGNAWIIIITFLALIICGVIIVHLNLKLSQRSLYTLEKRFFPSLGLGILIILLFPLASLIAFISFIGWPLGFLLIFAFGTFAFSGAIYAAQFLGCLVLRIINVSKKSPSFLGLVLGIVILVLLTLIPVAGWIITVAAISSGLGALILSLDKFRNIKSIPEQETDTE